MYERLGRVAFVAEVGAEFDAESETACSAPLTHWNGARTPNETSPPKKCLLEADHFTLVVDAAMRLPAAEAAFNRDIGVVPVGEKDTVDGPRRFVLGDTEALRLLSDGRRSQANKQKRRYSDGRRK